MDHLAKDLTVALEESESCGATNFEGGKWRMRRRTRSAGNLYLYANKAVEYQSEESSSSPQEVVSADKNKKKLVSFHQSDSDDLSLGFCMPRNYTRASFRMRHPVQALLKARCNKFGMSCSLESDSVNEHSPARPNLRRKRKLKRMSIDEPQSVQKSGKRKRPQRLEVIDNGKYRHLKIKPLNQSIIDKIEKFFPAPTPDDTISMEVQPMNQDNCDIEFEVASESSISWSGGEGHEGDDELTDWAPTFDAESCNDNDSRQIRAGCRRVGDERPGFSISTNANERVAKFLQDPSKLELRLNGAGAEQDKLGKLATLYSLEIFYENSNSLLLRKTSRTPAMQQTQRHHYPLMAPHKRIRTQSNAIS